MFDLQYIILGITQGITEFLPISSSAHLILLSNLFKWQDQGLINDIAIHFGTLGAVVFYLRKHLSKILINSIDVKLQSNYSLKIVVATIPAVIVGFFIFIFLYDNLRNLYVIAYSNILFAIILFFADRYSISKRKWSEISFLKCFFIGLCQSFAFIPGASRAGVTITGARILGINRESSAIFSMILSIPIIIASMTLILLEIYQSNQIYLNFNNTIISMIISFITALISINFMIAILKRTIYNIFIIYRILLGSIILILLY